jgi:putative ABC transport system permease protein
MTLKFTIRSIEKRPFLNLIKVAGLSLTLSAIVLIVLFLKNELTFDRFNKKSDRIYRFTVTDKASIAGKHFARVFNPEYIPKMAEYFPEIENYVRLAPVRGGVIKHNEDFIIVNQAFECDSTFFDIFDSELLVGDINSILNDPGSLVCSESFARKIFGNANPVGEILTLPDGQFYGKNFDFTVKGVMRDFPQNSHLHPEFITTPVDKTIFSGWAWTYLLLAENSIPDNVVTGFTDFYSSMVENKNEQTKMEAHLQKLTDIHLHSVKLREIEANRDMSVIYTLSMAAFILLLIALANFANLNIGMTGFSDKFIFVSKVWGSSNLMNLKYFLFEGIIVIICSFLLSGIISSWAIITIKKNLALNLSSGNMLLIIQTAGIFGLLVILACVLPLFNQVISRIKPSMDLRNRNNVRRKGVSRSIIVLQYTISMALIVAVFVIHRQTSYALKSSMGVENDNLICFEDVHTTVQEKFTIFKEELLKYNTITSVSAMFAPPGGEANDMFRFTLEGYVADETKDGENMIGIFPCDYSLPSIFKLKFLSGNDFTSSNIDNEGSGEYIINRSAMHRLNYTDPGRIIGKEFRLITGIEGIEIPSGKITGVVEDFHLSSIKKAIEPLVLFKRDALWLMNFVISFQPGRQAEAISDIQTVWTKMFPGYPFKYEYVSSIYLNVYRTELLQTRLLSVFTIIALFICSMGMLGMSLLTAQRRTKEIGIRKINGARISEILIMLNWDLVKWIIISIAIAIPVSFFFMNKWLENFAYKIPLSWWIFTLAGLSALLIVVITVSIQSWKAAKSNPVDALRYD